MSWIRKILCGRLLHIRGDIASLQNAFFMQAKTSKEIKEREDYIMEQIAKLNAAIDANKSATDAAIARVEARIAAIPALPTAELDALAVKLEGSTEKLNALLAENGASTGGVIG